MGGGAKRVRGGYNVVYRRSMFVLRMLPLAAVGGFVLATAATAQVGSAPVAGTNSAVGPNSPAGSIANTGNAAGDRARTGRDAIGSRPGVTSSTTGTVSGATPPVSGAGSAEVGGSVSGDGAASTTGTVGAGGTPPQTPPR